MISLLFKRASILSYLIAFVLLGLTVYAEGILLNSNQQFVGEQIISFLFLSLLMLAIDWTIKRQYWAAQANYHLYVFVLLSFVLPKSGWDNWRLIYFFLFWLAITNIFSSIQSISKEKYLFNAGFFMGLAAMLYPEGIVFYPFIWVLLFLQEQFNAKAIVLTALPLFSLYLLEVILHFFLDGMTLFSFPDFSKLTLSFEFKQTILANLWWPFVLIIFIISSILHFIDTRSKSSSYVFGINSLFALGLMGLLIGFVTRNTSSYAWILFIMTTSTLSTRMLEMIKSTWIREGLLIALLAGVCLSKLEAYNIF
jgi:hypothetical protein